MNAWLILGSMTLREVDCWSGPVYFFYVLCKEMRREFLFQLNKYCGIDLGSEGRAKWAYIKNNDNNKINNLTQSRGPIQEIQYALIKHSTFKKLQRIAIWMHRSWHQVLKISLSVVGSASWLLSAIFQKGKIWSNLTHNRWISVARKALK